MQLSNFLDGFQSTLPRGSDLHVPYSSGTGVPFQSTLPRGSDRICTAEDVRASISIHAPSRERLSIGTDDVGDDAISIHAPSRERPENKKDAQLLRYFNPRSLAGATYQHDNDEPEHKFQSTLPRGSDFRPDVSR